MKMAFLNLTVVLLIFLSGFASAKSSYETDLSSSTNNEAEPISRISIKDTSEEFIIKKPAPIGDKKYDDFLNFLYRHDTLKLAKSQRQRRALATREKRAVIFRPIFVYKKQEVKREKLREQKKSTKKPLKPTRT